MSAIVESVYEQRQQLLLQSCLWSILFIFEKNAKKLENDFLALKDF